MAAEQDGLDQFRVDPGTQFRLADRPTSWLPEPARDLPKREAKKRARELLTDGRAELAVLQERLYAENRRALLLVFQAMDAGGKDGTIRHVLSGVNPQGCQVFSFKVPARRSSTTTTCGATTRRCRSAAASASSTARTTRRSSSCGCTPSCSSASTSRRQAHEGPLAAALRGHQQLGAPPGGQRHPHREVLPARVQGRAAQAVPRAHRRPDKNWKFAPATCAERAHWDDYQRAYQDAIAATSARRTRRGT